MGAFDVHAHLTSPRLAPREAELLDNARRAGVTSILSNGLNPADNQAVLALAGRSDRVKPCLGLYPVDAVLHEMLAAGVEYHRDDEGELPSGDDCVAWVEDHVDQAFAIGEIGLDHYWVPSELWGLQEERFRRLLRLAREADKAVIVHSRKAERRMAEVLEEEGITRVDWHCYSSKLKLAQQVAQRPGQYFSIPANARRNDSFRRMLAALPRDRILLETDCPYLGPDKGVDNEPANVAGTVGLAAELWGESEATVLARLEENFTALFGVEP